VMKVSMSVSVMFDVFDVFDVFHVCDVFDVVFHLHVFSGVKRPCIWIWTEICSN